MYRKLHLLLTIAVIGVLFAAGCGKLTNEGEPPDNNPPEVFFANIPVDGTTFSRNPTIYWYGTDNDGTIEQYQYAVKRDFEVGNPDDYILTTPEDEYDWINIWVDSVQTATRGEVRLFASFDTNEVAIGVNEDGDTIWSIDCDIDSIGFEVIDGDTVTIKDTLNCVSESIQQYMFVRAIDDDGASSDIKWRQYLRNNHWPQTKIENSVLLENITHISIARRTPIYPGISVQWSGSDSSDYPRTQPDFEYRWRLFGPFNSEAEVDTLANSLALDSGDSLTSEGWIRRPEGIWTTAKQTLLIDLWRNQPESATTRVGYFLFEVQTRDDAFAPDPTPSQAVLKVVDAHLERRILIVDDINYNLFTVPIIPAGSGISGGVDDTLAIANVFNLLRDATNGSIDLDQDSPDFIRRWDPQQTIDIPIEKFCQYELVFYMDDDDATVIPTSVHSQLARYLNIGGKLWVFGRNCFLNNDDDPRNRISSPTVHPSGQFASFYTDVEEIYVPWFYKSSFPPEGTQFIPGKDDFVGALPAEPFVGILPSLSVDTARTGQYLIPGVIRDYYNVPKGFRFKTIPATNFLVLGVNAEALYLYQSRYAGTAFPHEKVVAARNIGPSVLNPVFKTAWFGTSPYGFEYEPMIEVFRVMLDWFEEPLP